MTLSMAHHSSIWRYPCPVPSCKQSCRSNSGLVKHLRSQHPGFHGYSTDIAFEDGLILLEASSPCTTDHIDIEDAAHVMEGTFSAIDTGLALSNNLSFFNSVASGDTVILEIIDQRSSAGESFI